MEGTGTIVYARLCVVVGGYRIQNSALHSPRITAFIATNALPIVFNALGFISTTSTIISVANT